VSVPECEGVLSVRTASSFHNVHGFNSSDLHKQPSFVQTPARGGASVTQFRVNIVYEKSSQLLPFTSTKIGSTCGLPLINTQSLHTQIYLSGYTIMAVETDLTTGLETLLSLPLKKTSVERLKRWQVKFKKKLG